MALFVPLDASWPDNVKIIRVGLAGAGLHAMAMCLCKRTETDGVFHRSHLHRFGADDALIDLLVDEGLFDVVAYGSRAGEDPARGYLLKLHDWHSRNPSQSELGARRSEAGRRGNHVRYGHAGPFEECPTCSQTAQSKPPVDLANLATASQTNLANLANLATERESETETIASERERAHATPDPHDADFDNWWGSYPRKVAKAAAFKAWQTARKTVTVDQLTAGLTASRVAWNGRATDKIPHAATWLNGRRWEDETSPAESSSNIVEIDGERMQRSAL